MRPINSLCLAEKLRRLRLEDQTSSTALLKSHPRLGEVLWFIQWQSLRPGGLERFVETLLDQFGDQAGSQKVREAGPGPWSVQDCVPVWKEARGFVENHFSGWTEISRFGEWATDKKLSTPDRIAVNPALSAQLADLDAADLAAGAEQFNAGYFNAAFRQIARQELPRLLVDLCEHPDSGCTSPWYFAALFDVLCASIDRHAASVLETIARTSVRDLVFRRLDFGHASRVPTLILGDARIGKTRSVTAWAEMYPGRARVVTVPSDDSMSDFYQAHARALGLDYSAATSLKKLKHEIEHTLEHSGLFLIYDESNFLVPQRYTAKTPPQRMDWLRSRVIDRGMGVAFFSTRQSYQTAMRKFGKATQYQFEQWIGRIAPPLILPAVLDESEILAAARANFPTVDPDILELVVLRCASRGTGLQEISAVVHYTVFHAQRAGRTQPGLADVDGAFVELLGEPCQAVEGGALMPAAKPPAIRDTSASVAPARRRLAQPISGDTIPDAPEETRRLVIV